MTVPSRKSDVDLLSSEQDAAATENRLSAEVNRLKNAAGEVLARLQHVRAASAQLQLRGAEVENVHRRVHAEQLPSIDPSPAQEEAVAARWAAVEARNRASERLRQEVQGWASELSRITSQLNADEHELQAAERAWSAREAQKREAEQQARKLAEEQRVAAAMPPPPPREAIQQERPAPKPEGRRGQGRVRMQATVSVESNSNFFTGFSTNLSRGGLFVATANLLPLGSPVDLRFSLPSGRVIELTGVVRWTRDVNDNTPEIFPGIGVQFEALPDDAARAIAEFVSTREPLFFPD